MNNLKFTSHDYFKNFSAEAETAIFDSLEASIVEELRKSKDKYYSNDREFDFFEQELRKKNMDKQADIYSKFKREF